VKAKVLTALFCMTALLWCGCLQTRMEAGRGTGFDTVDLSVGVLPVSGSLNPDQNMYPGFAGAIDAYGFFKVVEPVASTRDKKYDLLLAADPPGFAPEIRVVSGYSNKLLFKKKITALYGAGAKTAARELARAFAVGQPAYQEIMAEKQIFARQQALPVETAPAAAAIVSDVDRPAYRMAEADDRFALVVGVESYPRLPRATYADRDAGAVRDHLLALGYPARNVVLLTGQEASRAGLAKNIESWLARNTNENSTVFFYFSGHGAPDPVSGKTYLLPFDGDPQYLEDTAYPIQRLYEKLSALKARRIIAVLDCCFSGAGGRSVIAPGARPLVIVSDAATSTGRVAVLAAAGLLRIAQVSGKAIVPTITSAKKLGL